MIVERPCDYIGGSTARLVHLGSEAGALEFDEFFRLHHRRTVASVAVLLLNRSDAEDVVQEAFARASVRWSTISGYEDPEGWVRRVAHNLALSTLRRARFRDATAVRLAREPVQHAVIGTAVDLVRALGSLPLPYRTVLAMRYLTDMPVKQIADELGVPLETVRTRLARGRERLAEELGVPVRRAAGLAASSVS